MGQAITKHKKKLQNKSKKGVIMGDFRETIIKKHVSVESLILESVSLHEKREQYFADAKKAESWMKERIPIAKISEYGNDESTSLALNKSHELFMSELEGFHGTMQALKLQSLHISDLESKKSLQGSHKNLGSRRLLKGSHENLESTKSSEGSEENLESTKSSEDSHENLESTKSSEGSQENPEWENMSSAVIQLEIEIQYKELLLLAKSRQKKLNETTKTFILLREVHEHAIFVEKSMNNSEVEFLKINKNIDQAKFMENYDNFQINKRLTDANLYSIKQIITEFTKLGRKEELQKVQIEYQKLNERWTQIRKKLDPTYEKQRFTRDVDEITALVKEKLNTLNEMISIGHDLNTVKALQKKQEAFERELDITSEKVLVLNKRQKLFMQTNSDIIIQTYSKLEVINADWNSLIEGMDKWRTKLYMCYEIYKSLLDCHEMMERLSTRLTHAGSNNYFLDRNNNFI